MLLIKNLQVIHYFFLFRYLKFEQILNNEKEKNNELALLRKGDALFMKNNYEGALELYENVLKLNKNNEEALIGAGICKRKLLKLDEAINYYNKALEINNNNANTLYNKAIALSFKGNNNEANDLLLKAKDIKDSEDIFYSYELNNLKDKNYNKLIFLCRLLLYFLNSYLFLLDVHLFLY